MRFFVCDTCIETAFEAGFGDLQGRDSTARRVAVDEGWQFPEHECESHKCDCSCVSEIERECWAEAKEIKDASCSEEA